MLIKLLTALLLIPGSCSAGTINALFIGNSFTYTNSMPQMLSDIAKAAGEVAVTATVAPGGYTLQAHAQDNATKNKIAENKWNFIVLQEQSQRPDWPLYQLEKLVIPYALELDKLIRAVNPYGKTVFFETWGYKTGDTANCIALPQTCTYDGMQSRISSTYADLAKRTAGLLAPVGTAWREVRTTHPEIELYSSDGIHPSRQGSYLAACVFYSLFFRKGALGADRLGLPAREAEILQRAAQKAVFHPAP